MRVIGINVELTTSIILCLLFWLAYSHYPVLPPMDSYNSKSTYRRSPAIGLLAAGAFEIRDVANRMQNAVDHGSQKETVSNRHASGRAIVAEDSGLSLFVAPTSDLALDPNKRNRTRYTAVSDTIRCYSCMSPFYESAYLQSLSRVYAKPMNFSPQCDDSSSMKGIATVECPSICIKIREDIELSGIPFRGYIRGCYDTMLLHGFNQTLVRWFRWLQRDSCQEYNKYHILQLPQQGNAVSKQAPPKTLHICTCYADTCNGSPRFSAASVTRVKWFGWSFTFSLATTLGPLFALICWWLRTNDLCYLLNDSVERRRVIDVHR